MKHDSNIISLDGMYIFRFPTENATVALRINRQGLSEHVFLNLIFYFLFNVLQFSSNHKSN